MSGAAEEKFGKKHVPSGGAVFVEKNTECHQREKYDEGLGDGIVSRKK